jgi:hypothetical protein
MNFIKMKYENLSFLMRGKYSSIDELNQVIYFSISITLSWKNWIIGS